MLSLVFDTGFFIDVLTYVLNSKDGELSKATNVEAKTTHEAEAG